LVRDGGARTFRRLAHLRQSGRRERFIVDLPNKPMTSQRLAVFEVSEGRRLREMGLDPDGDPVANMLAVEKLFEGFEEKRRLAKKK